MNIYSSLAQVFEFSHTELVLVIAQLMETWLFQILTTISSTVGYWWRYRCLFAIRNWKSVS